jgi:glycosyltransferase involved in cell wall biosynthesis
MRNHIEPFRQADMLLVHNDFTRAALMRHGVPEERIHKLIHPVYQHEQKQTSDVITKELRKSPKDVIYCIPGFIYRVKGAKAAVKALKYLPDNYKLAIIGGVHPTSDDIKIYDKICDLIERLKLKDRVYITGFIEDDDTLDAMIRECDACVYPYDRKYYAFVSSGSLNLAFGNGMPVVAYPTESFKEVAAIADGALVLCETFAYYELARELGRLDLPKQRELSRAYAEKMAWPKMAQELVGVYEAITQK